MKFISYLASMSRKGRKWEWLGRRKNRFFTSSRNSLKTSYSRFYRKCALFTPFQVFFPLPAHLAIQIVERMSGNLENNKWNFSCSFNVDARTTMWCSRWRWWWARRNDSKKFRWDKIQWHNKWRLSFRELPRLFN